MYWSAQQQALKLCFKIFFLYCIKHFDYFSWRFAETTYFKILGGFCYVLYAFKLCIIIEDHLLTVNFVSSGPRWS